MAESRLKYIDDLIVELNKALVGSYVKKFQSNASTELTEEYFQAGLLGLAAALDSYDPSKGKFSGWAYHPIMREVLKAVKREEYPNMTQGDFEARPEILRVLERLQTDTESPPTIAQVAEEAGVTPGQAKAVLDAPRITSLDAPAREGDSTSAPQEIAGTEQHVDDQVVSLVERDALFDLIAAARLTGREQHIISCRHGLAGSEPASLAAIGRDLSLSREAIRQIEKHAMAKLRHPLHMSGVGNERFRRILIGDSVARSAALATVA
jgi:RNA polymerase sigma factor (sigma-70 family)